MVKVLVKAKCSNMFRISFCAGIWCGRYLVVGGIWTLQSDCEPLCSVTAEEAFSGSPASAMRLPHTGDAASLRRAEGTPNRPFDSLHSIALYAEQAFPLWFVHFCVQYVETNPKRNHPPNNIPHIFCICGATWLCAVGPRRLLLQFDCMEINIKAVKWFKKKKTFYFLQHHAIMHKSACAISISTAAACSGCMEAIFGASVIKFARLLVEELPLKLPQFYNPFTQMLPLMDRSGHIDGSHFDINV